MSAFKLSRIRDSLPDRKPKLAEQAELSTAKNEVAKAASAVSSVGSDSIALSPPSGMTENEPSVPENSTPLVIPAPENSTPLASDDVKKEDTPVVANNTTGKLASERKQVPSAVKSIKVGDTMMTATPTDTAGGLTYRLNIGLEPPGSGGYRAEQMSGILNRMGVSPSRVEIAMQRERQTKEHMSQIMRDLGFLTAENVARALAIQAHLEFFPSESVGLVDAGSLRSDKNIVSAMQLYRGFAPIYIKGSRLVLAVSDAASISVAANHFTDHKTVVVVASDSTIQMLYRQYFSSTEGVFDEKLKIYNEIIASKTEDLDQSPGLLRDILGAVLRHACTQKVSDIHMHMTEHVGVIKLTIDGESIVFRSIPEDLYKRILNRLISDAKIKEEDLRGGMKEGSVEWSKEDMALYDDIFSRYGFRLQLGDGKGGYTAVIRILDRNSNAAELANLNFDAWTENELRNVINTSAGLMLVTGPTGSGKTTTLYAILKEIDAVTRSIQTIENPVEYRNGLWMQYEISRAAKAEGAEWGKMLKGLLRNAPKVILLGEVRDSETAKILIDAANTGHLVFSTLHTSTAAMAIARLKKLEVDMDSLAAELLGVMAQRLVRILCKHCSVDDTGPDALSALEDSDVAPFMGERITWTPKHASVSGCKVCNYTGYIGRKSIYELMRTSPKVRALIESGASTSAIARAGIRPGQTIWHCGMRLVASGLTSIAALRSVAHKDPAFEGTGVEKEIENG
jgi:type IV pilus assembly protein PilB